MIRQRRFTKNDAAVKNVLNAAGLFFRRWFGLLRVLIGAGAFALGLWGWHLVHPANDLTEWANNLFRTLQLLTFQFPREADATLPVQLNIARFMVPSIALLESYRLVLGALRSPARLAMLGIRSGHIVVVPGKGAVGRAMLREVQAHDLRAVAIAPDLLANERTRMEEYRLPILSVDPFLHEAWQMSRADHASLVVISHGSDVDNLNIAVTAAEAVGVHRRCNGPMLVVALEKETLAEQVDLALDNAARRSGLRYRRLSVAEEAARMIFLDPLLPTRKADRSSPSHIVVVGLGAGALAVLRQALTLGQDAASAGPTITVLATEKELAVEPLLRPDTMPSYVATFRLVACDLVAGVPETVLETMLEDVPPTTMVCVCLEDDAAVTTAIALSRQATLRHWPDFSIAVHQGREDRFLLLLAREHTAPGHARLRPFGGILPAGTLQRLQRASDDSLPRVVHEHYLETLRRLGGAGGTPAAWDDLPENIRHANRAAADHMAVKLAAIGCRIGPGSSKTFGFSPTEIDDLARMEHRRWSAERLLRGWRLGARDDDRRHHPDLIPFEALDENGQEKDRAAVRTMPEILALAGLSIVRDV